ncbi:inhibitor of growth proteins N-terminal histone-binding-domain-containing protein [Xylariomycetidae sp. FL0641]|nr:inhibitor of growth proteins N-terminal histone-binding-domain-containing protein [Xylariomycetidae sp. FL0641]
MPRDDLTIDFVQKMAPSVEEKEKPQDPASILEEFINRTANLPEEIRFLQDELAYKDRLYHDCIKTIEESDLKIQKWIKANGSHSNFSRESTLRDIISENYARAEKLAEEKVKLASKQQLLFDKHVRQLDHYIKSLSDKGEPGFTDPDEIPSLIRPSAANNSNTSLRVLAVSTGSNPLNPILNNATPSGARLSNPQIRNAQSHTHISNSAPTTPAASMILNRNQRESSAGPGSGAPKRGPRTNSSLGTLPAPSSALARHSSLGPGTPKGGVLGNSGRAGSAGPRGSSKGSGSVTGRKGTPSAGVVRKKPPTSKSTLSRVKRAAHAKGSPASTTADSELSDAESPRDDERVISSRAGSGTPVPRHANHTTQRNHQRASSGADHSGVDEDMLDRPSDDEDSDMDDGSDAASADTGGGGSDDEDDEGKKYCLCQAVSYGDMVACDDPDCPYEWFHWNCVGLRSRPEGRWYCPACSRKKGK